MKAFKIILTLMIGIIIGAVVAAALYFFLESDVAWEIYLEEKLIPNAVIVLSAVGSLLVAAMPIINRVQTVLEKFGKATEDINSTVETGKRTDGVLAEYNNTLLGYNERIAAFENRFDELETLITQKLSPIEANTLATRKMTRIGFCNTVELVKNGYAAEISRVNKKVGDTVGESAVEENHAANEMSKDCENGENGENGASASEEDPDENDSEE